MEYSSLDLFFGEENNHFIERVFLFDLSRHARQAKPKVPSSLLANPPRLNNPAVFQKTRASAI